MKINPKFINFQVGPVNVPRTERAHYQGIIVSMLNGIIENINNPKEANDFVNFFLKERLSSKERRQLVKLKLFVNDPIHKSTSASEPNVDLSLRYERLNQLFGED